MSVGLSTAGRRGTRRLLLLLYIKPRPAPHSIGPVHDKTKRAR
jgi:hypothetical protein